MIEYRAGLSVDKKFEGGLHLPRGTMIYVRETPHGWLGTHYPDPLKLSAHGFALEEHEFSIYTSGDIAQHEVIAIPDPPPSPEKAREEHELAVRRLRRRMENHREEADEIERFLASIELAP